MWDKLDREDRIRAIREGVAQGMSAAEIAVWIGGITRNGIIGLAWRAKVDLNAKDGSRKSAKFKPFTPKRFVSPAVVKKPKPKPRKRPDSYYRVHLLDVMSGQCRFPQWGNELKPKQESMFYCGRPVKDMSSYCEKCHGRVYSGKPAPYRPKKNKVRLRGQFA